MLDSGLACLTMPVCLLTNQPSNLQVIATVGGWWGGVLICQFPVGVQGHAAESEKTMSF